MSVTKIAQKFITEHPSIKDCLRRGLINYSALSREICTRMGISQFDAVLIACRRYTNKIKAQISNEKKILGLIRRAKIHTRNKMMVAIVEKPRNFERLYLLQKRIKGERGDLHLIEGEESVTIISNAEYIAEVRDAFRGKILKLTEDLAQITMVFDEKIETTPGVVSFIYSLLADHSINLQEEMSCWTDLMMIIHERDAAKAMRVLSMPGDLHEP